MLARLPDGADAVLAEALSILDDDERANRTAARRAADLLRAECPDRPLRVLTHCNTGALATMGGGTALGAIRALAADGQLAEAIATETRPLLQGARLTVWELREAGLPHRLCVDSAAPAAMAAGMIDAVVVGADRIAANGDTANKIGTYALAAPRRTTESFSSWWPRGARSTPTHRPAPGFPIRGAGRRGGPAARRSRHDRPRHPGLQPGVRRHAGGPDHGDRHRGARLAAAPRLKGAPLLPEHDPTAMVRL